MPGVIPANGMASCYQRDGAHQKDRAKFDQVRSSFLLRVGQNHGLQDWIEDLCGLHFLVQKLCPTHPGKAVTVGRYADRHVLVADGATKVLEDALPLGNRASTQ